MEDARIFDNEAYQDFLWELRRQIVASEKIKEDATDPVVETLYIRWMERDLYLHVDRAVLYDVELEYGDGGRFFVHGRVAIDQVETKWQAIALEGYMTSTIRPTERNGRCTLFQLLLRPEQHNVENMYATNLPPGVFGMTGYASWYSVYPSQTPVEEMTRSAYEDLFRNERVTIGHGTYGPPVTSVSVVESGSLSFSRGDDHPDGEDDILRRVHFGGLDNFLGFTAVTTRYAQMRAATKVSYLELSKRIAYVEAFLRHKFP